MPREALVEYGAERIRLSTRHSPGRFWVGGSPGLGTTHKRSVKTDTSCGVEFWELFGGMEVGDYQKCRMTASLNELSEPPTNDCFRQLLRT